MHDFCTEEWVLNTLVRSHNRRQGEVFVSGTSGIGEVTHETNAQTTQTNTSACDHTNVPLICKEIVIVLYTSWHVYGYVVETGGGLATIDRTYQTLKKHNNARVHQREEFGKRCSEFTEKHISVPRASCPTPRQAQNKLVRTSTMRTVISSIASV